MQSVCSWSNGNLPLEYELQALAKLLEDLSIGGHSAEDDRIEEEGREPISESISHQSANQNLLFHKSSANEKPGILGSCGFPCWLSKPMVEHVLACGIKNVQSFKEG